MLNTDELELTMAERRDFLQHISELIKGGVLNRDDRDRILYVCLDACDRELAKERMGG